MTTATISSDTGSGRSRAAVSDRTRARAVRSSWARHLWEWLTDTGYRPERHYMRGSRTHGAASLRPGPA